jgi:trans-aconitate methyltransferase
VSTQGQLAAEVWKDPDFVAAWAGGDAVGDMLGLPRRIAAAVVGLDRPDVGLIVDVGSGPGGFLSVFLDHFPQARGMWTDASEAMRERAEAALADYGDRVEYRLLDMTELDSGVLPGQIDVLLTSRAVHHLDRSGLERFYASAEGLLASGGWLVNLDHIGPGEVWDTRLRAARKTMLPPRPKGSGHHHDGALTSVSDHIQALDAAGFTDVEMPWRAFFSVLFMARKS